MFRVLFQYGSGGSFSPRLPPKPWTPVDMTIGGSRTAAAGVPASYVVRRDSLLEVTLRIDEDEFVDLVNLLTWGQGAESFLFYPDADDLGTSYEVWLESPLAGERYSPERTDFLRTFETTITLRGVDLPPWPAYFP